MTNDPRDEDLEPELRQAFQGRTLLWALVFLLLTFGIAVAVPRLFLNDVLPRLALPTVHLPKLAATSDQGPARSVYYADRQGHFVLDATVNGAPIRFLVDTGATYVTLTAEDARAAGINRSTLAFKQHLSTANGQVAAAQVTLRELRIGALEQNEVAAVVLDGDMPMSLLGMSFLRHLDGYDIRDGKLSIF